MHQLHLGQVLLILIIQCSYIIINWLYFCFNDHFIKLVLEPDVKLSRSRDRSYKFVLMGFFTPIISVSVGPSIRPSVHQQFRVVILCTPYMSNLFKILTRNDTQCIADIINMCTDHFVLLKNFAFPGPFEIFFKQIVDDGSTVVHVQFFYFF